MIGTTPRPDNEPSQGVPANRDRAVRAGVLSRVRDRSAPRIVQHRLPAFQAPASDSLEAEMLSRLALTGEYQPDDLPRLARLAVLESISMLVNVRADLPDSVLGNQLDQEITALWNGSQDFLRDREHVALTTRRAWLVPSSRSLPSTRPFAGSRTRSGTSRAFRPCGRRSPARCRGFSATSTR